MKNKSMPITFNEKSYPKIIKIEIKFKKIYYIKDSKNKLKFIKRI